MNLRHSALDLAGYLAAPSSSLSSRISANLTRLPGRATAMLRAVDTKWWNCSTFRFCGVVSTWTGNINYESISIS